MPITEPVDEDELEADLAALEQENLDEKMLKTGTMPVADNLNRLPKAANGESKLTPDLYHAVESLPAYNLQSGARRKYQTKKMKKRNCENCRLRWLFDEVVELTAFPSPDKAISLGTNHAGAITYS